MTSESRSPNRSRMEKTPNRVGEAIAFSAALALLLSFGCAPVASNGADTTPAAKAADETATTASPPPERAPAPPPEDETETQAEDVFFAALPLQATPKVSELARAAVDNSSFAKSLRVRMHVMRGYRDLGELTRRSGLPLVNGVFQMSDLSHLESRDRPTKAYKQASFVVDFDEPALEVPSKRLSTKHPKPAPEDVARFVSEYIEQKSYQRAFDIASRVAESKAGDCTEHAVLTAALLRKSKFPARVILGIVLLAVSRQDDDPHLMAVGHSWVEYHDGRTWQIVDAALRPEDDQSTARTGAPDVQGSDAKVRLAYLPITVMKNEGIGFLRALMDSVGVESVTRVELDAAPAK